MSTSKKKILLVWNYKRADWISPFVNLSDKFEFVFLSQKRADHDDVSIDIERIYWYDFPNCNALLKQVRPDKIVFMSLVHGLDIVLNITAKSKNIPTYHLQHGLTLDSDSYDKYRSYWQTKSDYKKKVITTNRVKKLGNSLKELSYYINLALRFPILALKLLYYFFLKLRHGEIVALSKFSFAGMHPDKAISYTKQNAEILKSREKFPEEIFTYIGNPTLDDFFKSFEVSEQEKPFLLVLETALVRNDDQKGDEGISTDQIISFYKDINDYALRNDLKLKIKRHPYSWSQPYLYSHQNIQFIDEGDLVELIRESNMIIGFRSTAMIPAIYHKNCVLITIYENNFDQYLKEKGLAQVINFSDFAADSIDFSILNRSKDKMDEFVNKYIYQPDGRSTERLGDILNQS